MVNSIKNLITIADEVWEEISLECKHLIERMLSKEEVRPSADELLSHEWFQKETLP